MRFSSGAVIACPNCGTTYQSDAAARRIGGELHVDCLHCGTVPWKPRQSRQPIIIDHAALAEHRQERSARRGRR